MSKAAVTKSQFSARLMRRVALAQSTFNSVQRDQGTAVAVRVLAHHFGRSVSIRAARSARRLGCLEALASVLPLPSVPMRHDVLFIGYIEAALGLGESLRGLVRSVAATGLHFALYPFRVGVETRLIGSFMPDHYDLKRRHKVNVIEMAADQLPGMFREIGRRRTEHSYNILRTYWELPEAPREWAPLLQGIDEIWAPNEFVAQAFRGIFDGPITQVPPCVEVEEATGFNRGYFNLEEDVFYFIFSFDYFSHPARKNPLAVIRAFIDAFPDRNEKVGLVMKSTSDPHQYLEAKAEAQSAAGDDPRIKLIDRTFSRDEMLSLIQVCDCYVSLHRSEGFGLGMAEAMASGKPVVGTDYSGSTDFLSDRTGFPVPFTMRPVQSGEYIFSTGQSWAEPDHRQAVEVMRHVFLGRNESQRRAAAGKALVEQKYGRENVGRIAAGRILHILASRVRA